MSPLQITNEDEFDAFMQLLPAYMTVHLLPGTYLTKGQSDGVTPQQGYKEYWRFKDGQQLIGESRGSTTVMMVDSAEKHDRALRWTALGSHDYNVLVNGVRIRNLTVDCGMRDPNMSPNGSGQAVALLGYDNRVEDCDFINWGSGSDNTLECFVAVLGGGHINFGRDSGGKDNFMARCRAYRPIDKQGPGGATVFHAGLASAPGRSEEWVPDVRSGFVDCYADGNWSSLVRGFSLGGIDQYVTGCHAERMFTGFYKDTWMAYRMRIERNRFVDCQIGVLFRLGSSRANLGSGMRDKYRIEGGVIKVTTDQANDVIVGMRLSLVIKGTGVAYGIVRMASPHEFHLHPIDPIPEVVEPEGDIRWSKVATVDGLDISGNRIHINFPSAKDSKAPAISVHGYQIPDHVPVFDWVTILGNQITKDPSMTGPSVGVSVSHATRVMSDGNCLGDGLIESIREAK